MYIFLVQMIVFSIGYDSMTDYDRLKYRGSRGGGMPSEYLSHSNVPVP